MNRDFFGFRPFFYLVYAIVLTAGLLYLRFPAEKFKLFCEKRVEYYLSGSACSIDRIAYRFPFSLIVANFQITRETDGKRSVFRVGRCAVTPEFSSLFQAFDLRGEMYKGNFVLKLSLDVAEKSFQLSDLSLKGFDMDEWANDFNLLDRKLSGIVEYSGNYQAKFASPLDGTGKGKLVAVDGSMELLQPVLSLSNIAFARIAVDMTQAENVVKFIGGEMSGKEINADFTGEMRTTSPFLDSSILLSGHLSPTEGFLTAHPEEKKVVEQLLRRYRKSDLPYKVGGSVGRPTFRFSL
ncbi:MAG: hypothetical protein ACD_75C00185G0009 [uncultured bacterium]|nr:MAG: hypothetical protein ACD_75C00185G0009 [uncultured bacterium]